MLVAALVVGGLGEEVGWRGLAWARLRRELLVAAIAHTSVTVVSGTRGGEGMVAAVVSAAVIAAAVCLLSADRRRTG